jgi:hypothetical protein
MRKDLSGCTSPAKNLLNYLRPGHGGGRPKKEDGKEEEVEDSKKRKKRRVGESNTVREKREKTGCALDGNIRVVFVQGPC